MDFFLSQFLVVGVVSKIQLENRHSVVFIFEMGRTVPLLYLFCYVPVSR